MMCKSKIHHAQVTQANVFYQGSITIDRDLMDAALLLPFERVQVASLKSGQRLETYVIEGERGSGIIGMNGAAAKLIKKGETVHIISYAMYPTEEAMKLQPAIVHLDKKNRIQRSSK